MRHKLGLVLAVVGPVVAIGSAAEAQVQPADAVAGLGPVAVPAGYNQPVAPDHHGPQTFGPQAYGPQAYGSQAYGPHSCDCAPRGEACRPAYSGVLRQQDRRVYGGADYLLIRPHFSEAIAFAEGTQTPTSFQVVGRDLDFDYDSSFRVFAGLSVGDGDSSIRFTYTNLSGEVRVDGVAGAPGTFLVDPFGNIVGAAAVIDPHSRLFGQILPGGDAIRTQASVDVDVFDVDFVRSLAPASPDWSLAWSAGLRVADVEQFYSSTVTLNNQVLADGAFAVDYLGVGPRIGLRADRSLCDSGLSVFASTHCSLLVGEYDVGFNNDLTAPAMFGASQQESVTRLIPVLETELGAAYRVGENLRFSAGWLFQSWIDLGTSGGTFGGFFSGADDANIMSFDGLMLRAEVGF